MRRAMIAVHLWLGLILGGLWALQGLTGSVLVFHREIERLAGPVVGVGPPASLDRIAALGGPGTLRIGIVDGRGDLYYVDHEKRRLLIDPTSARLVGEKDMAAPTPFQGDAMRWVYRLHDHLLGDDNGEVIIGLSGLVLLSMAITGLWIGWPRRRQWRAAFSIARWRSPAQRLYGWHRASGIAVALALIFTTTSGAWMVFGKDLLLMLARAGLAEAPYKSKPGPLPVTMIGPQQALATARVLFPTGSFVRLTLPTPKAPVYAVRLRQPGEWRAFSGTTSVTLHAGTGAVLARYDALRAPIANRIADAAFALHNGEAAGLLGRIGMFLAGLALPTLYVTGILAWWRKRARRAVRAIDARQPISI